MLESQVQRPEVEAGCGEHEVVADTDWHVSPVAQFSPHPPQWFSLAEMSTCTRGEPQHRWDSVPSYWYPTARAVHAPELQ